MFPKKSLDSRMELADKLVSQLVEMKQPRVEMMVSFVTREKKME